MAHFTRYSASVVVPTYNRANLLDKTLDYCTRVNGAGEFEVIVVDDGSSDNSHKVTASYGSQLPVKYVWQPDEGFRLARARNLGTTLAEGNVVIYLDCGVLPLPGFLKGHLESTTKGVFTVGYTYGTSSDGSKDDPVTQAFENSIGPLTSVGNIPELVDTRREEVYRACEDNLSRLPAPWALAWGCNNSVEREAALAVGGFDEAYTTWGAEDVDFALSLFQAGAQFKLNRAAAAIHYPHPKQPHSNRQSDRANKLYMHRKFETTETALLLEGGLLRHNIEFVSPSTPSMWAGQYSISSLILTTSLTSCWAATSLAHLALVSSSK